jgi:serine/threonine protein kinase
MEILETLHLHDPVALLTADDPLKLKYIDAVEQLVNLTRRQPLLLRLASCENIVTVIRHVHQQLGDIGQSFGLDDEPAMVKWRHEWDADQGKQFRTLSQLITETSERMLVSDFRGEGNTEEALMTLQSSINSGDQLPEMLALKRRTIDRVRKFLKLPVHSLPVYSSFIASSAIVYEGGPIGGVAVGMRRGTWVCNGERREVAIELFEGDCRNPRANREFVKRLEWLINVPENDHILKTYGGSHLGTHPFYVYEKAPFGNLIDFLSEERDGPMFWRLFEQAAEGLKFLHRNDIAHGNLRCNNIMIGENYTVKLVNMGPQWKDWGMALTTRNDATFAGWKPVEQLAEESEEADARCEGDIYSLGMCMIEAITLEPPFGFMEDDTILELILAGECHPRPDGVSDNAWTLITEMCNPDYVQRPSTLCSHASENWLAMKTLTRCCQCTSYWIKPKIHQQARFIPAVCVLAVEGTLRAQLIGIADGAAILFSSVLSL